MFKMLRKPKSLIVVSLCLCGALQPVLAAQVSRAVLTSGTRGITFVAVDGHSLKTPQKQITVSPGRHHLALGVDLPELGWKVPGHSSWVINAPVDDSFKANHHYVFYGKLSGNGQFSLKVVDETEQAQTQSTHKRSNKSLQPTAQLLRSRSAAELMRYAFKE